MDRVIRMSLFGQYGQWGNQVFQYAFLQTYARRFGLDVQIPPWAGQHIYGFRDTAPEHTRLPQYKEQYDQSSPHETCFHDPVPPSGDELSGRDWIGWGQFHTSWYAPDRDFITDLFSAPVPEVAAPLERGMVKLRERGKTVISLHLRRADAGRMIYFLTPILWCLKWLREHWSRFDSPVLYLATEDPSLKRWFSEYGVVMMDDLGFIPKEIPQPNYIYPHPRSNDTARQLTFLPDWYVMQHSDVVLIGESTFSFTAAWLNNDIREFWRARLSTQQFHQEDLWNCPVSWREHLNDYQSVPGTSWDENPTYSEYWNGYRPAGRAIPEDENELRLWMSRA